jgi:DNA-binding SARP family transcriptional activator/ABC-type sugar transport system substrate-binding protein
MGRDMSDTLRIYTLGGLAIKRDDAPITGFLSRKVEALLVYLACTQRPQSREFLAEFLWHERSQAQAMGNLRWVLFELRQHLSPFLLITRQTVTLNPDCDCWLDVAELDRRIAAITKDWTHAGSLSPEAAGRLEEALTLYQDDFLAGFSVRECRGFEAWMSLERERLRREVIDALFHLISTYLDRGIYTAGINHATRLLQLDPLLEGAHRQMMRLLARSGQRNAALAQYETCRRLIKAELGIEPDQETTALYQEIRDRNAATDGARRPTPETLADEILTENEIMSARQRLQNSFIGIVTCTLETDYHASLTRGARVQADALNLPIKIEDARADSFRQPAMINSFVAQGAKAIVLSPIDQETVAAALSAAQEAGVVVVSTVTSGVGAQSGDYWITDEGIGRTVGLFTANLINTEMNGKANVAILDYPQMPVLKIRADAMEQALRQNTPNARILGRWPGALPENGERSIVEALKLYPELDVIMSINDSGGYGAVKALRAAGKKYDEVAIISVDAETEARRMIKAGEYFRASFEIDPVRAGMAAMCAVVRLLAGSTTPLVSQPGGKMYTRNGYSKTF